MFIPLVNEVVGGGGGEGGGYWFHHGCLSVCLFISLSVCLWKKWFLEENSIVFCHTMMMLHTCTMYWPWLVDDLYWFWNQKVLGQSHIWTLNFLLFLHDNVISFLHTMMILHTCIDHDPRRTSVDFGIKRSKSYLDSELFTISTRCLHFLLAYTYEFIYDIKHRNA